MREDIKAKMDGLVDKVCKSAVDEKSTRALIEEILALKGQLDVVNTEVEIPEDSVLKRYVIDDSMEVLRCKDCFAFHTACFYVIAKPTLAEDGGSLYSTLEWFCDFQDRRSTMDDVARDNGDTYCTIIAHMLALPRDLFFDVHLCIDIASYVISKRAEYYTALLEQVPRDETAEDLIENARFEANMKTAEALGKDMQQRVARKKSK